MKRTRKKRCELCRGKSAILEPAQLEERVGDDTCHYAVPCRDDPCTVRNGILQPITSSGGRGGVTQQRWQCPTSSYSDACTVRIQWVAV